MKRNSLIYFSMLLIAGLLFGGLARAQSKKHLGVGDVAPQFSLQNQEGKMFNLASEVGKHILVVYFYPKDESLVCTKEACSFKDSNAEFIKAGVKVIGINSGSVASHKSFCDHYNLPFTLLSDPDNKVLNLFGVKSKLFFTGRETFVIGLDGKIAFTYSAMMEGKAHSDEALKYIQNSKKTS